MGWLDLMKSTFKSWQEDKAARLGAALAYYTIFSIGPLLLVTIAIVGFVLGKQAAEGQLVGAISSVVGEQGASFIQEAVKNASKPTAGIIAAVIGLVMLLLAASGIFGQLQDALNTVWKVEPPKGGGVAGMAKQKVIPFLVMVGCGLLLLASLIANSALAVLGKFISANLPGGAIAWQGVNYVVSLAIITLLFAVIYRFLPDTHITWKDVWVGAALTSFLFVLGQIVLGFYLGFSNPGSPYGAAGSLVIVLVWIYYSAQIMLFGAEFTREYAHSRGSRAPEKAGEKAGEKAKDGQQKAEGGRLKESPWFS
ncbi:MAG: YihY/virulence factor BrkB family protein [Chloroflexia bacterium]